MKKRISIIMIVAMVISLLPTFSMAVDLPTPNKKCVQVEFGKASDLDWSYPEDDEEIMDEEDYEEDYTDPNVPSLILRYDKSKNAFDFDRIRVDYAFSNNGKLKTKNVFSFGDENKDFELGIIDRGRETFSKDGQEMETSVSGTIDGYYMYWNWVYVCLSGKKDGKWGQKKYFKVENKEATLRNMEIINGQTVKSLQVKSNKVKNNSKSTLMISYKKNKKANKYLVEIKNNRTGKVQTKYTKSNSLKLKGYKKGEKIRVRVKPVKIKGKAMAQGKFKSKAIKIK